jgi:hypothetical protein
MDDQQGNVIDGTARARQWRGSQSKPARAEGEGAAARSDAPKSIAGSLLVPAGMLPVASPGDQRPNGDWQSRTLEQPPRHGAVTADTASDEETVRQNPFLVPEAAAAASAGRGTRPARRRVITALLTRSVGAADEIGAAQPSGPRSALRGDVEQAPQRGKPWATKGTYARERSHHLRLGRPVIVGAVLLSVAAVSGVGIASQTNSTAARPRRASLVAATPRPDAGVGTAAKRVIGALGVLEHRVDASQARHRDVRAHRRPGEKSRARPRRVSKQPSVSRREISPPVAAPTTVPRTSSYSSSSSSPAYGSLANQPVTTQPAPPATRSAPQPAGPSGPGGTVGSNCNPKCS